MQYFVRALVLFTAMPVHECAHGFVAGKLGDNTARYQGRLTFNPLAHLDPVGGFLLVLTGVGWAKPVPVKPRNFQHPRRDMAISALAGPVSNILVALVLLIVYKLLGGFMPSLRASAISGTLFSMLYLMVVVNLYLAVFNFLPIPPLDGSKIFGALMPDKIYWNMMRYERAIALALLMVLMFTDILSGPLQFLAQVLLLLLDTITKPINWLFR